MEEEEAVPMQPQTLPLNDNGCQIFDVDKSLYYQSENTDTAQND
jgi:hypothetical protein